MDAQRFEQLVRDTEARFARDPRGVTTRTVLLALVGYAYLVLMLGAVLVLCVASLGLLAFGKLVAIKLTIVLGAVAVALLKSMIVKVPPLEGRVLSEPDAPALFRMVEELRAKLGAPPVHRVILSDDLNAAIAQEPRLGIFGLHRNTLILGMPLLQALSLDEVRAVVAHELGHLSGAHGKTGAWIYRVRRSWGRILQALERGELKASWAFTPFLKLYFPYFNAYSFVLARQNEHEADAASADVVGKDIAGQALVRVVLAAHRYEDEVVPAILASAEQSGARAPRPLATSRGVWSVAADVVHEGRTLRSALARTSDLDDTHPALQERLKALGVGGALPPPVVQSAAAALFGTGVTHFDAELAEHWPTQAGELQGKLFQRRARVTALAEKSERTVDESVELASLHLDEHLVARPARRASAIAVLDDTVQRAPEHGRARMLLGALLVDADDTAGIAHLEQAALLDAALRAPAHTALAHYYERTGDKEKRRASEAAIQRAIDDEKVADEAIDAAFLAGHVAAHALPRETLSSIVSACERHGMVRAAYVWRLDVVRAEPLFIVFVLWNRLATPTDADRAHLVELLPELPGPFVLREPDNVSSEQRTRFESESGRVL